MSRPSAARTAAHHSTDDLWRLVVENLEELGRQTQWRSVPPERRQRTLFALAAVKELRRRGTPVALLNPSDGRATRSAILGWGE